MQREYLLQIEINGRKLSRVIIDSHYEQRHANSMNDALILELVKTLNGRTYEFESQTSNGWEIYCIDPLYFDVKVYRLVWCLHPDESSIGVINAFRRSYGKVSK